MAQSLQSYGVGRNQVALLMNGTTDELKKMLHIARNEGIEGVEASNDCTLVWYLRRKAGTETKSLVLIAPKASFLGANHDDPVVNYNYRTKSDGWRFMAVSKYDTWIIPPSLTWLITECLKQGEGVTAWY